MSPAPTPRGQEKPPLSSQTLAWLAERPTPAARKLVYRVWATLTELQRSGRHPNPRALAALAAQLIDHQPSPRTGCCRACPHRGWRHCWQRPRFPCMVWTSTDLKLHGLFRNGAWPKRVTGGRPRAGADLGTAGIQRDLGQLDTAEQFAASAVRAYGDGHYRRGRTVAELLLAEVHVRAGESRGPTLARHAIEGVSTLQSVAVRRECLTPLATALEARPGTDTQELARTTRQIAATGI